MNLLFLLLDTPTPFINPTTFPAARFANLGILINILTPLLMVGGAVLFGGMLLFMAYKWLTAGSDEEQVNQARNIGTYAVLGIIIILTAYLAIKIIGYVLGVQIPI
jgi:hypothetical protein